MDREIPSDIKKKARNKLILKIALIALAILAISVAISKFLETSITLSSITVGTVDKGALEVTINASGKIVPLIEEIVVSPINSRILEVYKNAGDTVSIGEPILKLELASVETEYKQKLDELEMKKSKLIQSQIGLQSKISELEMQTQIKDMQLKRMLTELKNEQYLDSIGASTTDKIHKAKLDYEVAKLELEQMRQQIDNQKKNAEAEMKVQALDLSIFQKSLAESARLLKDARILSPQRATLTYINNQIGSQVTAGSQLAIISDLSQFKVEAEISDGYAERLSLGAKTIVMIGQLELNGILTNITPSVTNNIINFTVILNEANNSRLRSGLKVDVHVSHGLKDNVARLPNNSYYSGAGIYDLWVIRGNKAIKQKVRLGESSFEYVEVINGLETGDKVIISDISKYKHKEIIKIQKPNN